MIDRKNLLKDLYELGKDTQKHIEAAEMDKHGEMLEFALRNQLAMLHNVIERVKKQPEEVTKY